MFETKDGQAQWVTVYEHIRKLGVGDVFTDVELMALLPDAPEGSARGAFYRAVQEVEKADSRTFARVRTVGWRMAHARDHEMLARGRHKRARRQVAAARRTAAAADESMLTPEERRRIRDLELHLARHADALSDIRSAVRAERRERKEDVAALAEQVAGLKSLLERHGVTDATRS